MDENKVRNYRNQIGLSATIGRENVKSERGNEANARLEEVGALLNPLAQGLTYMGSAAVHVYWNETLEQVFFATQANGLKTHKCPELLAQSATVDLTGTVMEIFGHKRPVRRSGF